MHVYNALRPLLLPFPLLFSHLWQLLLISQVPFPFPYLCFVMWLTEFNKDYGESHHMALSTLVCDSVLAIPLKTATPSLLPSVKRYWFLRYWKDPMSSLIYDLLFIDIVLYRPKADELSLCLWLQQSCYVQKRALHGFPLLYPLSILYFLLFSNAPWTFDGLILKSWLGVSIPQSLHKEASLIQAW